jgi:hypothetical protein
MCLSAVAAAQNVLQNGGFETGAFAPYWQKTGAFSIYDSGAWSVYAPEGSKYAGFITNWGSGLNGTIVQYVDLSNTLPWGVPLDVTISGYMLLHARHFGSTWENVWMKVGVSYLDGNSQEQIIWSDSWSNTGNGNQIQWLPFSFQAQVPGDALLPFLGCYVNISNNNGMEWSYAFVDGISMEVVPVPEPSSILALSTGLVGLVGFAIRRRK